MSVTIPNSVISIDQFAFSDCETLIFSVYSGSYAEQYCKDNNLKYVVIGIDPSKPILKLPAAMKAIDEEAFAGSAIEQVIIPDGCESIGSKAFAECASLKVIEIPASVTNIAADAFDGCPNIVFVCPDSCVAYDYAGDHGIPCE